VSIVNVYVDVDSWRGVVRLENGGDRDRKRPVTLSTTHKSPIPFINRAANLESIELVVILYRSPDSFEAVRD
jgi:hypothetical protein